MRTTAARTRWSTTPVVCSEPRSLRAYWLTAKEASRESAMVRESRNAATRVLCATSMRPLERGAASAAAASPPSTAHTGSGRARLSMRMSSKRL